MRRFSVVATLLVVGLAAAGCAAMSPEQAVNISELHDGVTRLMPYASAGIRAEVAAQSSIANDTSRTQAERDAASKLVIVLTGKLMESKLLPAVSAPIRDWAIAKVGTDAYAKAKQDRDKQIGAGTNGAH